MRAKRNNRDVGVRYDIRMRIRFCFIDDGYRSYLEFCMKMFILTIIPNDYHLPAMFRNAQGMILHARASANVTKNKYLNTYLAPFGVMGSWGRLCLFWLILRRK